MRRNPAVAKTPDWPHGANKKSWHWVSPRPQKEGNRRGTGVSSIQSDHKD